MIALTADATLHPLVLPARADAGAAEIHSYADVRNRCLAEASGRDDDACTAEELLPLLASDGYTDRRQWRIVLGTRTVGVAVLNVRHDGDGTTATSAISILSEAQGRGIATAAAAHLEQLARVARVHTLQGWTAHLRSEDPRLAAPTGFGSVPHDHTARFLLRQGWTLEQVDRVSEYRWGPDAPKELRQRRESSQAAAQGYGVVQWLLPTPEEHLSGYACMKSRMSTDVPDADLGSPEEEWDAARVRDHDARWLAMGHTVQVTAAQHIATGELCAFNELTLQGPEESITHQNDTLVLAEHRGHRLGMLVKTAGLLTWRERHPRSAAVITYNAEENRPMLSINEEIGFAPIGYGGSWKKVLV
ncbi:MAG: GNAT family N-acetyltransferase [Actinobacteria bacterium]|nr:GNAT family N-acetyltransferase [Actinomycetota bacterium]